MWRMSLHQNLSDIPFDIADATIFPIFINKLKTVFEELWSTLVDLTGPHFQPHIRLDIHRVSHRIAFSSIEVATVVRDNSRKAVSSIVALECLLQAFVVSNDLSICVNAHVVAEVWRLFFRTTRKNIERKERIVALAVLVIHLKIRRRLLARNKQKIVCSQILTGGWNSLHFHRFWIYLIMFVWWNVWFLNFWN